MDKKMSFSAEIKDRLTEQRGECECCPRAMLAGFMRFSASFGSGEAIISTENKRIADCVAALSEEYFGVRVGYEYNKQSKLYKSILTDSERDLLCEKLLSGESAEPLMPLECCRRAFLGGAFLGGGSVNDPKKSYHLEFDTKVEEYAAELLSILQDEGINAKMTLRKGRYVVYVKDYESIASVLGLIGAGYAALELYNVSVEKEIRNDVNRQVNCDNANMKKQGKAASEHLHAISVIERKIGLEALSEALAEMARIRREYPDDSIQELGQRLNPPIGKSGVNHRLKRLIEIAENL